jgi:hypothetical protein
VNTKKVRVLTVAAGVLALTAIGTTQIGSLLKIVGIGAVVQKFGPQINTAMNKLESHEDKLSSTTKVVPILSVGSRRAVGAAQVMGPKSAVDQVKAVAELDQDLFGREVKLQAMIPIDSNGVSNIHRVENVGISGIVSFRVKI